MNIPYTIKVIAASIVFGVAVISVALFLGYLFLVAIGVR